MTDEYSQSAVSIQRASRISKERVDVEMIFHDGTKLSGAVFIGREQRVQDLLNDPYSFFPLAQENAEILLIAKSAVAVCKPLDRDG